MAELCGVGYQTNPVQQSSLCSWLWNSVKICRDAINGSSSCSSSSTERAALRALASVPAELCALGLLLSLVFVLVGTSKHEAQQRPQAAEGGRRTGEEDRRDVQAPHDPPRQGVSAALPFCCSSGLLAANARVWNLFSR